MPSKLNLIGQKFERLLVVAEAGRDKHGSVLWDCICECGCTKTVLGSNLTGGKIHSCGCLRRELVSSRRSRHRQSGKYLVTVEYQTWVRMIQRCTNPNDKRWPDYGGRGITVCDRWRQSFEDFFADMGKRPEGMSIDRINNERGYEADNCRWATRSQQAFNRRPKRTNHVHASG